MVISFGKILPPMVYFVTFSDGNSKLYLRPENTIIPSYYIFFSRLWFLPKDNFNVYVFDFYIPGIWSDMTMDDKFVHIYSY